MKRLSKVILLLLVMLFLPYFTKVVAAADEIIGEKYEKQTIQSSNSVEKYSLFTNIVEETAGEVSQYSNLTEREKLEILMENNNETYEVLVPKTNEAYEVALSYEDGSYTYVESASTYEEAVAIADVQVENLGVGDSSQIVVPTVLDSSGIVVYATESIGRVWKKYSDGISSGRDALSYIYTTSSLSSIYTYIHDGYISEVPIIQNNENEAKVLVAGYAGWMNKNINRKATGYSYANRDLIIQPITDVTNPSYYTVKNGILVHYISISMSTVGSGTTRTIGVAPSYLKEGQTYYSYDGNYFYDGSQGTASALRMLTYDIENGIHTNAVNSNNPYYNYYNYLPFRTKTNYTAAELDSFIASHTTSTSKLRGLGQAFIDAQNTYGVNALLALGIAINESAWGTSNYAVNRNNLFGLNATDNNTDANTSYYSSPEASVLEFAKNYISRGYSDPADWKNYGGFLGNKSLGANVKYASDPYWSEKAVSYAFQIDYELSGSNINNLRDYDYYQLILYTGANNVLTSNGSVLYGVQTSVVPGNGTFVGSVSALSENSSTTIINGNYCYSIYTERTNARTLGKFDGYYDWNVKGYVSTNNVVLINSGKTGFVTEDINRDGKVDLSDLAAVGQAYNSISSSSNWSNVCDVNGDGIVDIYDIVKVSLKL